MRGHLTLGVAIVALLAAVGGPSYAAKTVAKIKGDQIANHAVTGKKVGPDAITTSKVKDRSLLLTDLAPSTRTALRGQTGAIGATGVAGPKGDPGAPATRMFARVAADGTLLGGSPGATVTKLAAGDYELRWGAEDLSKCAAVATAEQDDQDTLATALRSPLPTSANAVRIFTRISFEAYGNEKRDFGFDVAVFC